jgi:hypothetical protein
MPGSNRHFAIRRVLSLSAALIGITASLPAMAAEVVVLATGSSQVIAGHFVPSGAWTTTTLTGSSSAAPAVRMPAAGAAIGVADVSSGSGTVESTSYAASWSALASIATGDTVRGAPSLANAGGTTYLAFQGTDFKYYFESHDASGWSLAIPPVGGAGSSQSFGPTPPTVAVVNGHPMVAFVDGATSPVNQVVVQSYVSGSWQPPVVVASSGSTSISPVVVAGGSGFDAMVVFVSSTASTPLQWSTLAGGIWSAPASLANALTNVTPSVAVTSTGTVLLAFEGTDTHGYFMSYSGGAWAPVSTIGTTPTVLSSSPAVAPGVGSALAEVAYVDSSGALYHTRLIAGSWTAPALIAGSGLSSVAIDSFAAAAPAPALGRWEVTAALSAMLAAIGAALAPRRRGQIFPRRPG